MKMKRVFRNIFFITLPSLLLFLFILELGLRLSGYLYTWQHRQEANARLAKSKGDSFNILCLGDSFTYGNRLEDSYPRQLERILHERVSKNINVVNGGIPGNATSLFLRNLPGDIEKYRPNIIIVLIGCNNQLNLQDSAYINFYTGTFIMRKLNMLLSDFKVYKLLKMAMRGIKNRTNKPGIDKDSFCRINDESLAIYDYAMRLLGEDPIDRAIEKFKEAIDLDRRNYFAHFRIASVETRRGNTKMAKNEFWRAVELIDRFDRQAIILVCDNFFSLGPMDYKNKEVIKFERYLKNLCLKNRDMEPVKIFRSMVDLSNNENIENQVLRYDLAKIVRLIRDSSVEIILQTYPPAMGASAIIREMSKKHKVLLVDNEILFNGKEDLFTFDKHCNAKGYKLVAENIYSSLSKEGAILRNIELDQRRKHGEL